MRGLVSDGVTNPFEADPLLVEVVRNGTVESVHHGRVAITRRDGTLAAAAGPAFAPMFPRSASKPLQAVGMVRAGCDLAGELLAVACASHSGEPFHTAAVLGILARSGLDESALQNTPGWPLDDEVRNELVRTGQTPTRLSMNCSGKHAAMIRTAVVNGWEVAGYTEPDHPVQRAILQTIDDLAGERAGSVAVDGCGAPLFAISLYGLARAFGRIACATDPAERRVAAAIREHPAYVSGTHRDEHHLHQAIPGLVAKAGAEAVYAAGLPDGTGVAVKISDGSARARPVAMAGVLLGLGLDHPVLREQASAPVLGHGERVGEIRPYAPTIDVLRARVEI